MNKILRRTFCILLTFALLLMLAPAGMAAEAPTALPAGFLSNVLDIGQYTGDVAGDVNGIDASADQSTTEKQSYPDVQVNGETLTFAYGKPEILPSAGRTMVPFRAIAEALGGKVDYIADSRAVSTSINGITLSFRIADSKLTRSFEGKTEILQMDIAPYEHDGTTYVPVKFFADALNLTVFWDNDDYTAVIFDRQMMVDEINSLFTGYNKWASSFKPADANKLYTMNSDISFSMEGKDQDGKPYQIPLSGTCVFSYKASEYRYDIQMNLWPLISSLTEMSSSNQALPTEVTAMLALYQKDLENFKLSMIISAKDGKAYFHCKLLNEIMKLLQPTLGAEENVWYSLDLPKETVASLNSFSKGGQISMGELIMTMAESLEDPYMICDQANSVSQLYAMIFGDQVLAEKDGVYTGDIGASLLASGLMPALQAGETFTAVITLDSKIPACDFHLSLVSAEGNIKCEVNSTEDTANINLSLVMNDMNIELVMKTSTKITEGEVLSLPKDAVLFPLDNLE